jgi:tetratricopeptide (TPR) repeat protein
MSSYRNAIIFFTFIILLSGCVNTLNQPQKPDYKQDLTILIALDSEKNQDYAKSFTYFYDLYEQTGKEIYLQKALFSSFQLKDYETAEKLSLKAIEKYEDNRGYILEYIIALTSQKKYDKAIEVAKKLLKNEQKSDIYELIANIYFQKQDFPEAVKYYESAYANNQNDKTLLKLVNILYTYLDKKDKALAYLETYSRTNKCNPQVCNKLLLIYQEQGNIDGMLSILTRMNKRYKDENTHPEAVQYIQTFIASLLEKKDITKAIKFLEETKLDQERLINLYYQNKQLDKALKLTKKIYKETKDPELLGKIAMYRFEIAPNKRKVMKHVIANFELALSSGINNSSYQNYYGYLLIDYDIDVEKGVELVKQALTQAPNNIAYLDSLAWGYYKLQKCEKAKAIMAKVVSLAGLNDPEIKLHWNIIKDCKKDKKKK